MRANASRASGPTTAFEPSAVVSSWTETNSPAAAASSSAAARRPAIASGGLTASTRPAVIGHHQTPSVCAANPGARLTPPASEAMIPASAPGGPCSSSLPRNERSAIPTERRQAAASAAAES